MIAIAFKMGGKRLTIGITTIIGARIEGIAFVRTIKGPIRETS
jgi:hypothetical protein